MRRVLLILLTLLFFVPGCKNDETPPETNENPETEKTLFELYEKTAEIRDRFYSFGKEKGATVKEAMMMLEEEYLDDPDLDDVYTLDSSYFYYTKNGITQIFTMTEKLPDGTARYRGSGGSKGILGKMDGGEKKLIENQKVLCFVPELADFYSTESNYKNTVVRELKSSDLKLEVDEFYSRNANLDVLKTMGDYGLVLIETHGFADGFMIGGLASTYGSNPINNLEEFNSALREGASLEVYTAILIGDISLVYAGEVEDVQDPNWWQNPQTNPANVWKLKITSKGLRNLFLDLSETVVVGNMCYSGWIDASFRRRVFQIDPIQPAFMGSNPISYYAYTNVDNGKSQVVENEFAKKCEDTLIKSLFHDFDTTGSAHLWNGTTIANDPNSHRRRLQSRHYGEKNYTFKDEVLIDPRDKKEYEIVRIGSQTWMAENLRYADVKSYVPPGGTEKDHGRFYGFEVMIGTNAQNGSHRQGICPDGWHIPSKKDWVALYEHLGYTTDKDNFFVIGDPGETDRRAEATVKLMVKDNSWQSWGFFEDLEGSMNTAGLNLKPDGRGYVTDDTDEFNYFSSNENGVVEYLSSSPLQTKSGTSDYDYDQAFYFSFGGFNLASISQYEIDHTMGFTSVHPCRCVKD